MKLEIKKQPKNIVEAEVELSCEEMKPFEKKTLEELAKEIKVKGFRPGKAPLDLVKKDVSQEKFLDLIAEKAINEKYQEIIEKEKLNPAGPAELEIQKIALGNPLAFKLKIPLIPKVKLGDYHNLKIKKEKTLVKDEEVDEALKELQSMKGKEIISDKKAEKGDKAKIDLDLFVDNVPIEGGQIRDFSVKLGQDQFFPGLSENLTGAGKNDEKNFSHNYPSDHYDKKLAGKKVDFKVKVKEIYQIELPEINDEFAQSMGPFKNMVELKEKIKENMLKEKEAREDEKTEIQILEKLIEKSGFEEIPDVLIGHEVKKMMAELKNNVESMGPKIGAGAKFEDYLKAIKKTQEDLEKDFIPKAEQRIKTALLIREIAEKEKIDASNEEVEEELKKLQQLYQGQDQALENLNSENGKIYIKNLVANEKVIKWLKEKTI